jgi:hypothetical protein
MVEIDRIDGLDAALAIKAPVDAATTAAITLSGTQTVDGVALVAGNRCLVKDQADGTEDGIYTVVAGTWTRASDWDGTRDAINGTLVTVKTGGTVNGNTIFRSSATDNPYVIDTVDPTFVLAEFLIDISGKVTWTFDSSTTTAEDPGTSEFRLNNATVASATVITVSANSSDNSAPDMSDWVASWDDSTNSIRGTIMIGELSDPSTFAIFNVTGAITDSTTHLDIPVTYVTGGGAFTASTKYIFDFSRTGNLGANAGVEMKWDVTQADADQGAGTLWMDAAPASAVILYMDDVDNAAGASINSWVDSWDDSSNTDLRGTVTVTKASDNAVFALFNVTGAVTSASTYSKVPVTYVTGAGAFSADDELLVSFSRVGDLGEGAGVRMKWDVSTNDGDQGAGTIWMDAAPASAVVVYMDDVEDAAGASINSWVDSFDDSTATIQGTLTLTAQTDPAVFAIFNVTGAVTSATTYSKIAVTYVTGAGAFLADDKVTVNFARGGNDGAGDLTAANNLSDVDSASTSLSNIGGVGLGLVLALG